MDDHRLSVQLRSWFVCAYFALLPVTAAAHHRGVAHEAPADAVMIPNLAHGQMSVMTKYRTTILDLAGRLPRTDQVSRRLVSFVNLQFSSCMWGIMPGSASDESSPFNECTHAYLAATKALLRHMQEMQDKPPEVTALADRIQQDMAASGTSLVMCRYSDEPFNTSERISPHWSEIWGHPPSLLALLGALLIGLAGVWAFLTWTRPPAVRSRSPELRLA